MGVNPKLLRRSPPFAELSASDVSGLAELASMRWIDRGEDLYRQGDPVRFFYVVLDGAVKLSRVTASGRVMVIDFRGPGELIGGRGIVGQTEQVDDARAVEDTLVAAIPAAPAIDFLSQRPAAIMALARYLASRLDARDRKVAALSTKRVHQRLAEGLLELGRTLSVRVDGRQIINARLTQAELADWIGTTRETTSTLLNELRRAGYIEIVGRRIHLLHPRALASYAELAEPPADLSVLMESAAPTSVSAPSI